MRHSHVCHTTTQMTSDGTEEGGGAGLLALCTNSASRSTRLFA